MGFCTPAEYRRFLQQCPIFERLIVEDGIQLVKYWFSVSDEEQERRFRSRLEDPLRSWKLSPLDLESRARWVEYSRAKDEMFVHTDIEEAPWYVVEGDDKRRARLNCIAHLLSVVPYEDVVQRPVELPPRPPESDYQRPPRELYPVRARLRGEAPLLTRVIGAVVDLNADVGEGFAADAALVSLVTSVNVACGFHAGGGPTMLAVCTDAVAAGVAIGAHVSYRDREGFGRRELAVAPATVAAEVAEQLAALQAAASAAGGRVAYLKPHGALYHRASGDPDCARAVVAAAAEAGGGPLAVLGFPGSSLLTEARAAGLVAVAEGFADRAYTAAGTLRPRTEPGAVLAPGAAARQAVALAERRLGGGVRSICIHGDGPEAAAVAGAVREALASAHVELRPFA